jgi:hypothetical protein
MPGVGGRALFTPPRPALPRPPQECKYKGHRNSSTQVRASLSARGDQIACGTDDGWVYLWDVAPPRAAAEPGKNPCCEAFLASPDGATVTAALFCPDSCRAAGAGRAAGGSAGGTRQAGRQHAGAAAGPGAPGCRELLAQQAHQRGQPWQLICTASFSGELRIFEVYKVYKA